MNKTESTGGPYRTFKMEVLAGEAHLETSLKENGCSFLLDFSKVYWNSRLETEHRRIVDSLGPDDVLADAFCGIGPFAVPSAVHRRCKVYANDLNPSSVEYLRKNVVKNGLSLDGERGVVTSCECARTFLRRIIADEHVPVTHVVMNFPSGAPEFLDVFRGLYANIQDRKLPMPKVFCYCFVRGEDWVSAARTRAREALGLDRDSSSDVELVDFSVRDVRDVAPKKRQVCISFILPSAVAYGDDPQPSRALEENLPQSKRQRIESP